MVRRSLMACSKGSTGDGFCSPARVMQGDMHVRVSSEVLGLFINVFNGFFYRVSVIAFGHGA